MKMTFAQSLRAQVEGRTVPMGCVDDDTLSANTQDGLRLTAEQRAEAEADLRRMRKGPFDLVSGPMTKEASRAVAVSFRLHLRAIGAFA